MTWTCIVQMLNKNRFGHKKNQPKTAFNRKAFTLTELVIVILIVGLLSGLAMVNLTGLISGNDFKTQTHEFITTMQLAATSASQNGKYYDVIINLDDQSYMLREISGSNLDLVYEDEVIVSNEFNEKCIVVYVVFDDGVDTSDGIVHLRVGKSGWQAAAKIILVDNNNKEYSVLVSRIGNKVKLEEGDAALLLPKEDYEIPF